MVSVILRTLSVEQVPEDEFIWKAKKNVEFSVESAYQFCMEEFVDTFRLR